MEGIGLMIAAAVCGLFALAALRQRRENRRLLRCLNAMLDDALLGEFRESRYDESQLSAVESRMAQYLAMQQLTRRELEAEKDRVKSLIGDISHQTKTPTANLVLYTQLLAERPLDADSLALARNAAEQAEKLRFLMDALVKMSRLESGIIALSPSPSPLLPVMQKAAGQVLAGAAQKGILLTVEPTDTCAVMDGKWTAEALFNLLDNAVKYTPAGGRLTVSAHPCEAFCRVDVQDTGCGIPESEQGAIFSRFYRGSNAGGVPGLGIGLSLTRQIIAGQGGWLRVRSRPGQGSVFSLYLPKAG